MGIQRQFNRLEYFDMGEKWPSQLRIAPEGKVLHPRKGYRDISIRRGRAQIVAAEQKAGRLTPYTIYFLDKIRTFLKEGRW